MLVIIILTFGLSSVLSLCNIGDSELFGRCYQFNNHHVSYSIARHNCENRGFVLSRIENLTLARFIGSFAVEKFGNTYGSYWIGLHRNDSSSDFQWEDKNSKNFEYWANGYPYAGYNYGAARLSDTKWITLLEEALLPYICSYDDLSNAIISTLEPSSTPENQNGCQESDLILENRCYSFIREKLSLKDARKQCEKIGRTLAIFDDSYQIKFVSSYAQTQFATTYTSFWIGLQRDTPSTPFYWQDGGSIQFTNWSPGYPYSGQLFVGQDIANTKWKTFSDDDLLFSVCSGTV